MTSHSVKIFHTDNEEEYVISELQFFLKEWKIIYKTSKYFLYIPIK